MTVTYCNMTFNCSKAVRGSDYIHLLDANNSVIAAFEGVSNFNMFSISGGSWTTAASNDASFIAVVGEDGVIRKASKKVSDIHHTFESGLTDAVGGTGVLPATWYYRKNTDGSIEAYAVLTLPTTTLMLDGSELYPTSYAATFNIALPIGLFSEYPLAEVTCSTPLGFVEFNAFATDKVASGYYTKLKVVAHANKFAKPFGDISYDNFYTIANSEMCFIKLMSFPA